MWSLEWPVAASAAHRYMSSPSPTGTMFDLIGEKHEPPDLPEIDPDLLSTLDLPRTSVDSIESIEQDATMIDNWQINEVFQDISTLLSEETEDLHPNIVPTTDDIEKLVKDIYTCYPEDSSCTSHEADMVSSSSITDYESNVDLSWIIKETIGSEGLADEPALFHEHVCADNFDLLEQLEAMQEDSSSVDELADDATPIASEPVIAVANDHQYTQLASVTAKPHETKKQAMRRVKNNAASRVCRKQRRNRLTTNMGKVGDLMAQNEKLTQNLKQVEELVTLLKEHLVKATCKK